MLGLISVGIGTYEHIGENQSTMERALEQLQERKRVARDKSSKHKQQARGHTLGRIEEVEKGVLLDLLGDGAPQMRLLVLLHLLDQFLCYVIALLPVDSAAAYSKIYKYT